MCAAYPGREIPMFSELVDEYWHTFILFTKDYFAFCRALGMPYIHHEPAGDDVAEEGPSYAEFCSLYEQAFQQPLPEVWNLRFNKESRTCYSIADKKCGNCKGGCNNCCSRACKYA